jgi:transposase
MSLKTRFPTEIPEATRALVEPLLAEESVYRLIGQEVEQMVGDEEFETMYAEEGRPAVNAVLLALITVFQFLEKVPDRAAAMLAVMRLDWKYALRQEVNWSGFHYSDLCNFRKRLLAHGREGVVFERIVAYLRERGYVKAGGKQRTDSTHIVGQVMALSRLELVWETIRVALNALISADAPWVLKWLPSSFVEVYSVRRSDYRLKDCEVAPALQKAGEEGQWLVSQVMTTGRQALQGLPELALLRRVLDEQYAPDEAGQLQTRPPGQVTGDVITSPHDPSARYGNKGRHEWIGYKLHVTETLDEDWGARFITDVTLTEAFIQDNTPVKDIQQRLIDRQVPPAQQYVDQGYMSGANLQASLDQSIDLRGFIRDGNVTRPEGFRLSDFSVDVANRQATCPAGQAATRWSPLNSPSNPLSAFQVSFGKQCQVCPFFGPNRCTDKPTGRTITLSRHHDLIQARRAESKTEAFHLEMHQRAAVEGTISELVRAHAARRSRYRGLRKNHLQATFTAAATNLKRLARALAAAFCRAVNPLLRSLHLPLFLNNRRFSTESCQSSYLFAVYSIKAHHRKACFCTRRCTLKRTHFKDQYTAIRA